MSVETMMDLEGLRAVGNVVAMTLHRVTGQVRAGVTTAELDEVAAHCFSRHRARSGPAIDYGFPGTICISINEQAVHGIPGARVIAPGDMVTIDVTAELDGYYADAAVTVVVEPASRLALRLKHCAEAAFRKGLDRARAGAAVWRIGDAVDREVRRRECRVLRDLCGHGVGRAVHEEPSVPNYRDPSARSELTENLVITIEPIVSATAARSRTLPDGWTIVSGDGSLTAHHEHTLIVRRGEPLIVTAAA